MVDAEEDYAVVPHLAAETALLFQGLGLLATGFAPVVDEAVVAPAHVLLETATVIAMHPAVGVAGVAKYPADHVQDAGMPRRVAFLDLCQLGGKIRGGEIAVVRHDSLLAGMDRREGKNLWVIASAIKYANPGVGAHCMRPVWANSSSPLQIGYLTTNTIILF